MTIPASWRDDLLDERQRKETALAEVYSRDYNHGTAGHNAYVLIARLAELLDAATGVRDLAPPPEPSAVVLTFGKWSGTTLGELLTEDYGYLEWLAREARDPALRKQANIVLATANALPFDGDIREDEDDLL